MRQVFFISILLLTVNICLSQPPSRYLCTIGGDGDDVAYSGKQTLDRQYILAGSSSSYGSAGSLDMYLVKVDTFGFAIWQKFIGGNGTDVAKSVIQLPDSGYILTGFTSSFGSGGYDAYTVRTGKNGDVIWERTFGGSDWEFANDLVRSPDGNVIVVGHTRSFGNGKKDGFMLKYDLLGNLIWKKFIGGIENEELNSVIRTSDNFLASVGYTESNGDLNGDIYFVKFNNDGDTIFTRTIGGPYKDFATDLVQKYTNEYEICGAKTFSAGAKTHSYLHSISATGTYSWENTYYHSTDDESMTSLANSNQTPDRTAYLRNVPVPSYKMQGNIFIGQLGGWPYLVNSFGGGEDETFYSVEATADKGYVSVGSTLSYNSSYLDIIFVKQDSAIVTYPIIAGIRTELRKDEISISYLGESRILVEFDQSNIPDKYTLFDIDGRIVKTSVIDAETIELNLSSDANLIFVIKFSYNGGKTIFKKIINK